IRRKFMKIRTLVFSAQALALCTLLAASPSSFAAEASGDKTTAKDVSRKAGETGRALKDYTVAQRDEALKQAKAALDDADARIRGISSGRTDPSCPIRCPASVPSGGCERPRHRARPSPA